MFKYHLLYLNDFFFGSIQNYPVQRLSVSIFISINLKTRRFRIPIRPAEAAKALSGYDFFSCPDNKPQNFETFFTTHCVIMHQNLISLRLSKTALLIMQTYFFRGYVTLVIYKSNNYGFELFEYN